MPGCEFELYLEEFEVTAWKDGAVYKTKSLGARWFLQNSIDANKPSKTNRLYVAASDDFANSNMTIRRFKRQ